MKIIIKQSFVKKKHDWKARLKQLFKKSQSRIIKIIEVRANYLTEKSRLLLHDLSQQQRSTRAT